MLYTLRQEMTTERRHLISSPTRDIEDSAGALGIKIRSRGSAIDQEIGTRNERSAVAHQQFGDLGDLVGCPGTTGRTSGEHALVEIAVRPVELVQSEGARR